MDLYDFMNMCVCEDWITVAIYDTNDDNRNALVIGEWYDIKDDYEDYEVVSFDIEKVADEVILAIDINYERED